MNLTQRQQQILNLLVEEYIENAEPISSELLKKRSGLNVSGATIRNELQELTEQGYIIQPHTSAGRVPTNKGYQYFIEIVFLNKEEDFLEKEIELAKQKIEKELALAEELTKSLKNISSTLRYTKLQDKGRMLEILEILGPSRTTYEKNIDLINKLIEELDSF